MALLSKAARLAVAHLRARTHFLSVTLSMDLPTNMDVGFH